MTQPQIWRRWLIYLLAVLAIFLLIRFGLQHNSAKLQDVNVVNHSSPPVQFDFYTVLPKMAVSVASVPPKPLAELPPVLSPAPVKKSSSQSRLVLQIAALGQLHDAQRLRDQMRTAGYPAFIQSYRAGSVLWYRVMIGPYASLELTQHTRNQLKEYGVSGIIVKTAVHE